MAKTRGPALTVDALWILRGSVLLVRRGRPPFAGSWALPGGFVEPSESVEEAIVRELLEETGLRAAPARIIGVYSGPDRDPRGPSASVAFWMRGQFAAPRGGDDAAEAAWVPLEMAKGLAFDHGRILLDGLRRFHVPSRRRTLRSSRALAAARPAIGRR